MAVKSYVGSGDKAKNIKSMFVGVGGKAHRVLKAYVGVNGKAKLVYSLGVWEKFNAELRSYTTYTRGSWAYVRTDPITTISGRESFDFSPTLGYYVTGRQVSYGPDTHGEVYVQSGAGLVEYANFPSSDSGTGGTTGVYSITPGEHTEYYYAKGSTSYGLIYGLPGDYPDNGYKDGYWYVKKT